MGLQKQEIERIKKELPQNSYSIISKMLAGRYKPRTIEAMFRDSNLKSSRTMNDEVLTTAKQFLETLHVTL